MKKVALVGYGHWGKNLARCFNELGALVAIVDADPIRFSLAKDTYLRAQICKDVGSLLRWIEGDRGVGPQVDAIVIATPPETHYDIAHQALNERMDVFIEKPMTTNSEEAKALCDLAKFRKLNLMVGHIYLHNGGVKAMPIPVGKAELYIQLLNEKGAPSDSTRDVVWAGLPHVCSLALHFFPDEPESIWAKRDKDRIRVVLNYWNGSTAYLDVGDNTGRKLRRVELDWGSSRYLFDVKDPNLCYLQSGIEVKSFGTSMGPEPLMEECKAFLEYQGVDLMGPKVVKLIEEIISQCT